MPFTLRQGEKYHLDRPLIARDDKGEQRLLATATTVRILSAWSSNKLIEFEDIRTGQKYQQYADKIIEAVGSSYGMLVWVASAGKNT